MAYREIERNQREREQKTSFLKLLNPLSLGIDQKSIHRDTPVVIPSLYPTCVSSKADVCLSLSLSPSPLPRKSNPRCSSRLVSAHLLLSPLPPPFHSRLSCPGNKFQVINRAETRWQHNVCFAWNDQRTNKKRKRSTSQRQKSCRLTPIRTITPHPLEMSRKKIEGCDDELSLRKCPPPPRPPQTFFCLCTISNHFPNPPARINKTRRVLLHSALKISLPKSPPPFPQSYPTLVSGVVGLACQIIA